MPAKLHRIKLSGSERQELESIRDQKRGKASRVLRAVALLLSDEGPSGPALKDAEVRLATAMSPSTLERLRIRCCEVGPLGALERKQREKAPREIKITGEVQARVTQLACSTPPEGHARWTLRLLADHLALIGRNHLKKSQLKPWQQQCWCIPPKQNADRWYVAYHRHAIPGGGGHKRQVCLARMEFDADGSIKPMDPLIAP